MRKLDFRVMPVVFALCGSLHPSSIRKRLLKRFSDLLAFLDRSDIGYENDMSHLGLIFAATGTMAAY